MSSIPHFKPCGALSPSSATARGRSRAMSAPVLCHAARSEWIPAQRITAAITRSAALASYSVPSGVARDDVWVTTKVW